jgi:hypothetical protein
MNVIFTGSDPRAAAGVEATRTIRDALQIDP